MKAEAPEPVLYKGRDGTGDGDRSSFRPRRHDWRTYGTLRSTVYVVNPSVGRMPLEGDSG